MNKINDDKKKKKLEKIHLQNHDLSELKQENLFLHDEEDIIHQQTNDLKNKNNELEESLKQKDVLINESQQREKILDSIIEIENTITIKKNRKYVLSITLLVISIGITVPYLYSINSPVGIEYKIVTPTLTSEYLISNLKGDTIDTWLSWRLIEGSAINVNLIDGSKYPDKVEIVKTVLLSEELIEIDNSLLHKGLKGTTSSYYVGWAGALGSIKTPTEFHIPKKFNLIESAKGEGDITIRLTSQRNGDGYSGYTKSIADESQNQILKSEITIFEVDKLSKAQFETILRHELGHAFGLAHSTAPEDLMYPTIQTDFPYISECDIDAIVLLYDNGKKSHVVCNI